MNIEENNDIDAGCGIVRGREMAQETNVCEQKLVKESRFSPLCRQVMASISVMSTTISVGIVGSTN